MPSRLRSDSKPVVEFDPLLELSPFVLFRNLRDKQPVMLVDVRAAPAGWTLRGAQSYPGDQGPWPEERRIVLFDDDGSEAYPIGRRLQQAGQAQVKVLFGGLELYEFALDPEVVGADTYLERIGSTG